MPVSPGEIGILGWCPAGQYYLMRRMCPLALVGHPYSGGITIKIPYGVDVLLHQPVSHAIFS